MNTDQFAIELVNMAREIMTVLKPQQQERSRKLGKQFLRLMRKGEYNGAEMSLALITVLLAQLQRVLGPEDDENDGEIVKPKRKKEEKRGKRKR
ncbi:hypothetical protein LCGC14_1018430 [marine sediment metagenome]|uniref:Uncharacterized protein n=1 Tax=marine sediment metagenome TaxID=412755 RepID=A0A0F9QGB1_9ZZZZ